VTGRRGRGEDSVYLDGDRWRGAASLGYGPDGRRIRKKVSGATKPKCYASCETCGLNSVLAWQLPMTGSQSHVSWIGG
jgi:hypothetical protein